MIDIDDSDENENDGDEVRASEPTDTWGLLAHRGQLSVVVLTLARAEQLGMPIHAEATYVVVIRPDGSENIPISMVSLASVVGFVEEMQPRSVAVDVCAHEDPQPLVEILSRAADTFLH